MRISQCLSLVVMILPLIAISEEFDWRFSTDEITPEQWSTFRSEVLAKSHYEQSEFAHQLVIIVEQERAIYVFTQPGHPAHPAVVVRKIVPRGINSEVQRMGHYAGNETAFAAWWREFDALDAKVLGVVQ